MLRLLHSLFAFVRFTLLNLSFFFYCSGDPRHLHSFPTRRSSDLPRPARSWSKLAAPSRTSRTCARSKESTRSEEHTSELQSPCNLVCRLLLEKKKTHILTPHFSDSIIK